jgi:beta-lactamase regulating signal transducer with metallopeptidase domain
MMLTFSISIPWSAPLLTQLVNSAVRVLALAGIAALGLAVFRVKAASFRLFTWTAVLYAALALPLLGWMLPPLSIPMPAFLRVGGGVTVGRVIEHAQPSANESMPPATSNLSSDRSERALDAEVSRHSTSSLRRAAELKTPSVDAPRVAPIRNAPLTMRWMVVASGIYFAVALFLLGRFIVGLVFSRRLVRSSRSIHDPRVTARVAACVRRCGLSFVPQARESEFISVPVTMGALRSAILLPTAWSEWDDAKLDAVIAHEVSHVARRDALTQRLSLLHRAFFWFSPLAWWLDRQLADLAEQASDEAALSYGADRNAYAKTLLGFFEALHAAPGRVWWQGVSMAKAGQAERRLQRILSWKGNVTMNLRKSIAVAVIAIAVPVVYLAASARPANHTEVSTSQVGGQERTPAAEATPSPEANAQQEPAPAGVSGGVSGGMQGLPAAIAPAAPIPPITGAPAVVPDYPRYTAVGAGVPVPPQTVRRDRSYSASGSGYSYAYGYDDQQRFVIVTGKSDSLTMSGSTDDARHVEKLRKQIPGDFIWFQRDEESYIIRDEATIDRARKLWAPQEELGKKQEALGKQQEALGKQQEELGAKMQQIRVKVPDMTAAVDKLRAELKELTAGATTEQVSRIESEIGELQSKIGEIQSHAGDQQAKLGDEQGALGEKQGKLGEEQGELGRQQGELAEQAARQMKILLDEAITKGTAQPEAKIAKTASL